MANKVVVVCDECGELGKPVGRYRLSGPEGTATVVLCREDARPISKWLRKSKPRDKDLFSSHVTTMEEIEAQKAQKTPSPERTKSQGTGGLGV